MKKKKKQGNVIYYRLFPVAKVLSPIFRAIFYIGFVLIALIAISSFIVLFVNADVNDMLLPPHMHSIKDAAGNITDYSLNLGNGIKVISPADKITLSHIKTVIYSGAANAVLTLGVIILISRFLSRFFAHVGKGEVLDLENSKMVNYIGVTVLVGNTLTAFVKNLLNYVQINKFVEEVQRVEYAFNLDWAGIITGIFILLIGTVYGYACMAAAKEKAVLENKLESLLPAQIPENNEE